MAGKIECFEDLGNENGKLSSNMIECLKLNGFTTMSPIQRAVLPYFLSNSDVAVEACTGSGKTLAYVIPIIQKMIDVISKNDKSEYLRFSESMVLIIGSLIIAPTRELVQQIHSVIIQLLEFINKSNNDCLISSIELFGGRKINSDKKIVSKLVTANDVINFSIIVTTPGRLNEHLLEKNSKCLKIEKDWTFKKLEILVIDEADKIFEQVFQFDQIKNCLQFLPKKIRKGIFSATLSDPKAITASFNLRNVAYIKLNLKNDVEKKSATCPISINNYFLKVSYVERSVFLMQILLYSNFSKIIVFFPTCYAVDFFYEILGPLVLNKLRLYKLHGKLNVNKRKRMLKEFDSSILTLKKVLLTSDLGCRGIDFVNIDLVIQFEPPKNPEDTLHRIGRTGRIGNIGDTILFLNNNESEFLSFLEIKCVPFKCLTDEILIKKIDSIDCEKDFENCLKRKIDDLSAANENLVSQLNQVILNDDPTSTLSNSLIERMKNKTLINIFLKFVKCKHLNDRNSLETGVKTFVSHIRSYKEKQLKYIFVYKNLDIASLAILYGIFKLPKLKEYTKNRISDFEPERLNIESINFKNPVDLERKNKKLQKISDETSKKLNKSKKPIFIVRDGKESRTKKRRKKIIRDTQDEAELWAEEKEYKKNFKRMKLNNSNLKKNISLINEI